MVVDAGSTRNDTSPRFNSKRLVPMIETGSYCLFCKKCSNKLSGHTFQSPSQFLEKVRRATFLTTTSFLLTLPSRFGCKRVFIVSGARSHLC